MTFRGTLGLLALALALGLYVYLVEIRGERAREAAEAETLRVFSLGADKVTALELPLEDGERARVVRDPNSATVWALEEPLRFPADAGVINGVVLMLEKLEAQEVIEEVPEDLTPFGLGDERVLLRVWSGDTEVQGLFLGKKTPVGSELYVARENDKTRILTIEDWRVTSFRPSLYRLRDKRMLKLEPSQVAALRVHEKGVLVVAARCQSGDKPSWVLEQPRAVAADTERIERLLKDLTLARATAFVDEPETLEAYGLHTPELEIRLKSDDALETLYIGREAGHAYVRAEGATIVYETQERLLDGVPRDFFAYRYKQVLELDADRIQRIELAYPRGKRRYVFERDDDRWVLADEELEVDSLRVEDVRYAIEDLEATGIETAPVELAALGLAPPRVRVAVFDDDDTELGWLELGDEAEGRGIAARSSQGEEIWWLGSEITTDLPLDPNDFREEFLEVEEDAEDD